MKFGRGGELIRFAGDLCVQGCRIDARSCRVVYDPVSDIFLYNASELILVLVLLYVEGAEGFGMSLYRTLPEFRLVRLGVVGGKFIRFEIGDRCVQC
ncbi:hypothetical protein HNY73_007390 [Argiope bruennichi]|uniref:Uncharacterized protein n=1 Tax=Argiope bruennichi TaxID=94029 RepID=A0A8T0FKU0_ARGBR|nr:hypothetical protein HNY73_007390 [Argiope bruennichi]